MGDGARCFGSTSHLHDDGFAQILSGQGLDLRRHRRAEQQSLPISRDVVDDPIELRREPHVQHSIGFVQHQYFQIVERHVAALHVIQQTTWGRDHDVDSTAQRL